MRFLIEVGAAKDQAANDGTTPIFLAAYEGHLDIVRILVENGADKDQAHNECSTPLSVAAQSGHLDILQCLVEVGAANGAAPFFSAALN